MRLRRELSGRFGPMGPSAKSPFPPVAPRPPADAKEVETQVHAEYHISQINIASILAKKPQGHQMRWAREWLGKREGSVEPCVVALLDHLDDASAANKVAGANMRKPPDDIDSALKRLDAHGCDIPTTTKTAILDRALDICIQNNDIKSYMESICPWPLGAHGPEPLVFKPSSPRLLAIEGSKLGMALTFRSKILSYITVVATRGEAGVGHMSATLSALLKFFEENAMPDMPGSDCEEGEDQAEEIDEIVDEVVAMAKALQGLLAAGTPKMTVDHVEAAGKLKEIFDSKDLQGKAKVESAYHFMARELGKEGSVYNEKWGSFQSKFPAYKRHVPALHAAMKDLASAPSFNEGGEIHQCFVAMLKDVWLPASAEMPTEMVSAFEDALSDRLMQVIQDGLQSLKDLSISLCSEAEKAKFGGLQKSMKEVLNKAGTMMPSMRGKCGGFTQELESLNDATLMMAVTQKVKSVVDKLLKAPVEAWDEGHAKDMSDLISAVQVQSDDPKEALLEISGDFAELVKRASVAANAGDKEFALWLPIVVGVSEWVKDGEGSQGIANILSQMKLCEKLAGVLDDWNKLGGDAKERADADNNMKATKAVLAVLAEVDIEAKSAEGIKFDFLSSCRNAAASQLEVAKKHVIDTLNTAIAQDLSKCRAGLEGAKWPVEQQSHSDDWDAFVKVGKESWLEYKGGDELVQTRTTLAQRVDDLKAKTEAFTGEMFVKESQSAVYETLEKIDALVFCVKIAGGLGPNSTSKAKLRRWAKAQGGKIAGDNAAIKRKYVPDAVVNKLNECSSI